MNSRQLYKERHKRWGTASVWCAQWWSDGVEYCKSPEGKRRFDAWIRKQYGPSADAKPEMCYAGPHQRYLRADDDGVKFHKAAVELGVSDEFVKEAFYFCGAEQICIPEATLPPPSRKRGESSMEWLERRNEATLLGCKTPPINWQELRRIATSQFDLVRDLLEVWRTQPDMFLDDILERANSTLISARTSAEERHIQACMAAVRTRLHIAHIQHAAWSKAVAFFKECDKMGTTGPTAVLRACKQDDALMGRLVAMICWITDLRSWLRGKLPQVLTSSEATRPYFIRERNMNGVARIQTNSEYTRAHLPRSGSVEDILATLYKDGAHVGPMKFGPVMAKLFASMQDPRESKKLTAEAVNTIGDLAAVEEFCEEIIRSTFGTALREAVQEAHQCGADKVWYPYLSPIAASKLRRVPASPSIQQYGDAASIVTSVTQMWMTDVVFPLDVGVALTLLMRSRGFAVGYDVMWQNIDKWFWDGAQQLERGPGALKEYFGLYAPKDRRPIFMVDFLGELTGQKEELLIPRPAVAAPEPYVQTIPIATPQESVARASPRAPGEKKVKVKKRKEGAGVSVEATANEPVPDEIPDTRNLPDILAENWKLSRKNFDIFSRLLGNEEKSGQIRWGDFEKAMKQIGFDIVQTEGSSVRFDPPARKARSITFHRPHPDSTLTPIIMKWIGARLKRCYGWTMDAFAEDPTQTA